MFVWLSAHCVIITNWHAFQLRKLVHSTHRPSNNTVTKLRRVVFAPPLSHPPLHFSMTVEYSTHSHLDGTYAFENRSRRAGDCFHTPTPTLFRCQRHQPSSQLVLFGQNHHEYLVLARACTRNDPFHYCYTKGRLPRYLHSRDTIS